MSSEHWNEIIIVRCCTNWPIHRHSAYGPMGRCGICRQTPIVVEELYPESLYARNQISPDSSMDRATDF